MGKRGQKRGENGVEMGGKREKLGKRGQKRENGVEMGGNWGKKGRNWVKGGKMGSEGGKMGGNWGQKGRNWAQMRAMAVAMEMRPWTPAAVCTLGRGGRSDNRTHRVTLRDPIEPIEPIG